MAKVSSTSSPPDRFYQMLISILITVALLACVNWSFRWLPLMLAIVISGCFCVIAFALGCLKGIKQGIKKYSNE